MAPAVKKMMRTRPWDSNQKFDWRFIRRQWEYLAAGNVFVEASPPNLIRVEDIKAVFGRDSSGLVSMCNPYQHISSAFRRYLIDPKVVAINWARKAREIMRIRENYPFFLFAPYEVFVESPHVVNDLFDATVVANEFSGKRGSGISGIRSGYCRALGFLTPNDVNSINSVLEAECDVMNYFGYSLLGPEILDKARMHDLSEFQAGLNNRKKFNRRFDSIS